MLGRKPRPLLVEGAEESVGDYRRYDNPWSRDEFDSHRVRVADGDRELYLDFPNLVRNGR